MRVIKKASFEKRLEFVAICPYCKKYIREPKMPEINDIIFCGYCCKDLEVMSTKNYEYSKIDEERKRI